MACPRVWSTHEKPLRQTGGNPQSWGSGRNQKTSKRKKMKCRVCGIETYFLRSGKVACGCAGISNLRASELFAQAREALGEALPEALPEVKRLAKAFAGRRLSLVELGAALDEIVQGTDDGGDEELELLEAEAAKAEASLAAALAAKEAEAAAAAKAKKVEAAKAAAAERIAKAQAALAALRG